MALEKDKQGRELIKGLSAKQFDLIINHPTRPGYTPDLSPEDLSEYNKGMEVVSNRINQRGPVKGNSSNYYEQYYADDKDRAQYAADDAQTALQAAQQKIKDNATKLSSEAKQFRSDLPGYIDKQVNPEIDSTKANLANQIQSLKQNTNARGLLGSGIESENVEQAKGFLGSGLSSKIQTINKQSQDQADFKDKIAFAAESSAADKSFEIAQFDATQKQTAYDQAMRQKQNENDFFSDLMGSVAQVAAVALLV